MFTRSPDQGRTKHASGRVGTSQDFLLWIDVYSTFIILIFAFSYPKNILIVTLVILKYKGYCN